MSGVPFRLTPNIEYVNTGERPSRAQFLCSYLRSSDEFETCFFPPLHAACQKAPLRIDSHSRQPQPSFVQLLVALCYQNGTRRQPKNCSCPRGELTGQCNIDRSRNVARSELFVRSDIESGYML